MKAVNPCGLKRAALINDLSCFGKCSLSVSMPILSSRTPLESIRPL